MIEKKLNRPNTRLIKSQMVLRGYTFPKIAKEIGVTREWVSSVVNGHANSGHIKKEVANILGVPYVKLWGDPGIKGKP